MEKLIAFCGLDCAGCGAYIATKNNDQALREKTAAEWTVMHNFNFTSEMINCTSCNGDGIKIGHCSQCAIRKCATEKRVANCGACDAFKTCETIQPFLAQVPCAAKNLAQ